MKHGQKRKIGQMGAKNVYLVQFRVQAVAPVSCQASSHNWRTDADGDVSWEVRMYQNTARLTDLLMQGVERDRASQVIWDEACREQDTLGVRVHSTSQICDACLFRAFEKHVGQHPLMLATMAARVAAGGFLIVSERKTESAGIISPFDVDIEEKDILKTLRDTSTYPIRFKDAPEA